MAPHADPDSRRNTFERRVVTWFLEQDPGDDRFAEDCAIRAQ